MKLSITLICAFLSAGAIAQNHSLEKIWETDAVMAIPESVLPVKNMLYISLIDGGGWDADGKGGVGKLSPDGKNMMAAGSRD